MRGDDEVVVYALYRMHENFGSPSPRAAVIASGVGRKILGSWLVCELTFFMDTDSTGAPETAVRGLHRVKLARQERTGDEMGGRGEAEGNASHTCARSVMQSVDVRGEGERKGRRTNLGHGRRCMSRRRLLLATLRRIV